ncbi:MAG TPA: hypothetical protein VGO18_16495, partial [Steroidobacteraceae bacterium]|nr:hypothetical protein [Steroidobacteraceae bacterium]
VIAHAIHEVADRNSRSNGGGAEKPARRNTWSPGSIEAGMRIPVILITLFTVPEEGTADSMKWRWTATTDG